MAKLVSSYCTKVIGENRIFKDTIRVYHDALSLLIRIVESEWDTGLGELYAKSTLKAQRTVELLVHASRTSVAKYPEFDKQFYKYPSYLRRSTISEALGAVSSYRAAVSHWESAGRKGKEPKLQTSRSAMPTFYKDNMYEDNGDGTARLKLYHKNDWVWVKVRLRKQDTDYIRHMKKAVRINEDLSKKIAPAIVRYAVSVGADIIVMEHLDFIGQKPKHKKQRLHMWRNRDIQKIVMHQAHRNGIRVRFVNARNTSRLAFDGSGEVARNSTNMALCRFQNGKQYNCDLNASYNIGARYFIRE